MLGAINNVGTQVNMNQTPKVENSGSSSNNTGAGFGEVYLAIKSTFEGVIKVAEGSKAEWAGMFKENIKTGKKEKNREDAEMDEARGILKQIEKIMNQNRSNL
jgi:hypothetical protein